jgi:hypothetical protein
MSWHIKTTGRRVLEVDILVKERVVLERMFRI